MRKLKASLGEFAFPIYYVTTPEEARKVVARLLEYSGSLGIDIETAKLTKYKEHRRAGLCPRLSRIRLVQIYDGKSVFVFDIDSVPLKLLSPLLLAKNFIGHNSKFELSFFTHNGIPDIDIGCSMLMSQMVNTAEHSPFEPSPEEEDMLEEEPDGMSKYKRRGNSLEDACGTFLGIRVDKANQLSDWSLAELSESQILYAASDALLTYHLGKKLGKKIREYKMEDHYRLLKAVQYPVVDMELNGMPFDWESHAKLVERWDDERAGFERKAYPYFGSTNLNSSKQMVEWVERYFRREPDVLKHWPKTPKGAYSFNATSLSNFRQVEPIKHLLNYKQYTKLLNSFGESLLKFRHPVTNRIHSSIVIGDTRTGRMSMREPNGQQFPKNPEFRALFKADNDTKLVVSDLSQIELRAQAELSRDPVMLKVYREGRDIYKVMAASLLKKTIDQVTDDERQTGKIIMLGLGFGMGGNKLQEQAWKNFGVRLDGLTSHATYHRTFRIYSGWCTKQRDVVSKLGFGRTKLGKMRKMVPEEQYTKAVNFPVQGSCAELLMLSLVGLRRKLKGTSGKLLSTVHDEVLVECDSSPEEAAVVCKAVEDSFNGAFVRIFPNPANSVVAKAKAVNSWAEKK